MVRVRSAAFDAKARALKTFIPLGDSFAGRGRIREGVKKDPLPS